MNTLDSTFQLFFNQEPSESCTGCGAEDNLIVLYRTLNDRPVWICSDCQQKSKDAQKQRSHDAAAEIAEWVARDEWEEA